MTQVTITNLLEIIHNNGFALFAEEDLPSEKEIQTKLEMGKTLHQIANEIMDEETW